MKTEEIIIRVGTNIFVFYVKANLHNNAYVNIVLICHKLYMCVVVVLSIPYCAMKM